MLNRRENRVNIRRNEKFAVEFFSNVAAQCSRAFVNISEQQLGFAVHVRAGSPENSVLARTRIWKALSHHRVDRTPSYSQSRFVRKNVHALTSSLLG